MSWIFQDLEVQLKGTQQEIPESEGRVEQLEKDLSVVKERDLLQEKEILQKTGKIVVNIILKYLSVVTHIGKPASYLCYLTCKF